MILKTSICIEFFRPSKASWGREGDIRVLCENVQFIRLCVAVYHAKCMKQNTIKNNITSVTLTPIYLRALPPADRGVMKWGGYSTSVFTLPELRSDFIPRISLLSTESRFVEMIIFEVQISTREFYSPADSLPPWKHWWVSQPVSPGLHIGGSIVGGLLRKFCHKHSQRISMTLYYWF